MADPATVTDPASAANQNPEDIGPDLRGFRAIVGFWRGRALGLVVLALCLIIDIAFLTDNPLRRELYDVSQQLMPRPVESDLPVIVAIDERSIAEIGQWPWPRTVVADLIDRMGQGGAITIGVDVLFLDPDRQSPRHITARMDDPPAGVVSYLQSLPDYDEELAATIAQWPVVLGLGGTRSRAGFNGPVRAFPVAFADPSLKDLLVTFPGADQSVEQVSRSATGQGLLNAIEDPDAIIRRIPAVALVDGRPVPAFALEMLRVALGGLLTVKGTPGRIDGVQVGDWFVPTESDGTIYVPFSPPFASRYVSAVDVLRDDDVALSLEGAIAMIGLTGQGLVDLQTSPLRFRAPGIDVHAQLVEAIHEEYYISRPDWTRWLELAALIAVGLIFVFVVPVLPLKAGVPLIILVLALTVGGGLVAYATERVFVDTIGAAVSGVITGIAMLTVTLMIANAHRKALGLHLQRQREERARLQGELDAAREIQLGLLPGLDTLPDISAQLSLAAMLEPARDVGGDLYDFFMIDDDRLFLSVGDVSGKGVPASLFMAISKALCKSAVLRDIVEIDEIMMAANAEISRENPNMLFVTLFAGILNLRTGHLDYCNAGHEPPLVFTPGSDDIRLIEGGGGPPVCVMDDFPYMADSVDLVPGEMVLITTDGIGEAMNHDGELYGNDRLYDLVRRLGSDAVSDELQDTLYRDVKVHADGAPASDDITIMAFRWMPPSPNRG
ncbi:MAG: CHASE2 domain-containing protein [Minwuia sp.]|nr:CHASE2 domain-containing protein [Minwuia sp.]